MGGMSDLDLSIRELIFEGTLEENIKENVGTKIKIRDYVHVVSEQDIKDYYKQKPCVVCGKKTNIQIDHKNGLYNNPRVNNTKTQKREEF